MSARIKVEEKQLTDGSKVYNVLLLQANQVITLECPNKKDAEKVETPLSLNTDAMLME